MTDHESLRKSRLCFTLGAKIPELRYFAEHAWCSRDEESEQAYIKRFKVTERRIVTHLQDLIESSSSLAKEACRRFLETTGRQCTAFPKLLRNKERLRKLEQLRPVSDPEFEYDVDCYLLCDFPLTGIHAEIDLFKAHLSPGDKACFELAWLLNSELYPTLTAGGREAEDENAYYQVDYNCSLRQAAKRLIDVYPLFNAINFEMGEVNEVTAMGRIDFFLKKVDRALFDPASVQAKCYLNLVLDKEGGQLTRNGKKISLRGTLSWNVLVCLYKHKESYCSLDSLAACWESAVTLETVSRKLSDLRVKLKPLCLTIVSLRTYGWRIEELQLKTDLPSKDGKASII